MPVLILTLKLEIVLAQATTPIVSVFYLNSDPTVV